uniref:Uncharacterized protein n=1 Tax=Aegilops tauschii subsp. strangulata TaxID=200361 RepID=A0A453IS82_AEGTS
MHARATAHSARSIDRSIGRRKCLSHTCRHATSLAYYSSCHHCAPKHVQHMHMIAAENGFVFECRGSRLGVGAIGEETADERIGGGEGMMRGRCIPGRKRQPQQHK